MIKKQIGSLGIVLMLGVLCMGCAKQTQNIASQPVTQESSLEENQQEVEADNNKTKGNDSSDEDYKITVDSYERITDPGIETDGKIDHYLEQFSLLLKENGLELEDRVIKDAASIGALEGYGFNVNRVPLEVYLFDEASSEESTIQNLKTAQESGYITIFHVGINGEVPKSECTLNHNLVLIFPSEDYGIMHPNKETIIEAFKSIEQ